MTEFDFDLFTIGAGSGGVRASRMAAQYGARVGIAEEYRVGGTCVIRGCVPKKLFVYASQFHEEFEDAAGFGWTVGDTRFDWPTLIERKDKEIDRLNKIYIRNLDNSGAQIFDTRAELVDAHTVRLIAEDRTVTAKNILIATGAWPFKPASVEGIDYAITSNEAFHLESLPRRILVVGGGYIAVEFSGIFHGLGVETTLSYRGPEILRGFDDDLRVGLHRALDEKGLKVLTNSVIKAIKKTDEGYLVSFEDGSSLETDLVMYATGRNPNTAGLGLENAGVALGGKGEIKVNAYSQSSQPHIYAVGDVTDRVNLTPVAIREGAAFAETVFNNNPISVDHADIPTAVFSQPEIGTVGLTESEAAETYGSIDIYRSEFRPMKHTLSERNEKTMMKLLVDPKSSRVVGCHVLGPHSGELIQAIGIAVKLRATKKDFDATIAVHPTSAEELVTMKEKVTVSKAEAVAKAI